MLRLLYQELNSRRGSVLGWGIGLGLFAFMIVTMFPSFAPEMAQFESLLENDIYKLMGEFTAIATLEGFVSTEVFSFAPLIFAIYGAFAGATALAGEEEAGTLELTMSLPVRRWQLVLTKAVGLGITIFFALVLVGVGLVLGLLAIEGKLDNVTITPAKMMLSALSVWPLVMSFTMMALFLGAYLPTRRLAATATTIVLVASFLGNNLAALSEPIEKIKFIFPFNYFNGGSLLVKGVDTDGMWVLLAISAAFLILAVLAFQRRNVTVHAWPWQRAKPQEA